MLGVIGGSGMYELFEREEKTIETPYGKANLTFCDNFGIVFIARHGKKHVIAPHDINHKANIFALSKSTGKILSLSSVGIIDKYSVGDLILVEDFIGLFTSPLTYFDTPVHTAFENPYKLNSAVLLAAEKEKIELKKGGVLIGAVGPRLETAAEIKAMRILGGNVVGMTTTYEAILANELKMEFANVVIGCNKAPASEKEDMAQISSVVKENEKSFNMLAKRLARDLME